MITAEQLKFPAMQLDEKDRKILKVLQADGRLSIREVAAKVHLSPTPVQERIKRLEREGVIIGYAAQIDSKKIGQGTIVLCQVTIKEHNKKATQEFASDIMELPEVTECYNVAGDADFILKIVTSSIEAYHEFFLNKLSEVKHIGNKKSIIVMDVIKQQNLQF